MTAPGMNSLLGDVYGNRTHTEEDLAKEANLQFFGQLCEHQQIDVEKLSENEISELFKVAMEIKQAAEEESAKEEAKEEGGKKNLAPPFGKHEAGESKDKEKKEEQKKEAAAAEWAEKRAAHVKVAEADATGRIMAHAMVDELRKIAAAQEEAAAPSLAEKAAAVIAAAQAKTASAAAPATSSATPNFDELAAINAIDMLKQAGQDEGIAQARISAVFTLGLQETAKIAAATTPEAALTLRALEFCEAAGYPVDWTKA
jgi:hypothetical protein